MVAPAFAEDLTARVLSVKDGDSFVVEIVSFNTNVRDECRMLRYNAPELDERVARGVPDGRASARKLADLIDKKKVHIRTRGRNSYRKVLCDVWLMDGTHVNRVMWDFLADYNHRSRAPAR
jgi:endonuclease YncB( thermonuclease family)